MRGFKEGGKVEGEEEGWERGEPCSWCARENRCVLIDRTPDHCALLITKTCKSSEKCVFVQKSLLHTFPYRINLKGVIRSCT